MKNSVLDYGNFVSGRKKSSEPAVTSAKASDTIQNDNAEKNQAVLEEITEVPSENKSAATEPAIEIPSINDILYAGEPEELRRQAEEKEKSETAAKTENPDAETSEETPSETQDEIPEETEEDLLAWEVPLYDARPEKKSAAKKRSAKNKSEPSETTELNKQKSEKKALKKQKKQKALENEKSNESADEAEVSGEEIETVTVTTTAIEPEKTKAEIRQEKKDAKLKAKAEKIKNSSGEVKRPIVVKLIAIISLIVIASLVAVTVVVSKTTSEDTIVSAETQNRTQCSNVASDFESRVKGYISSVQMFYYLADSPSFSEREVSAFFEGNREIGAVVFLNTDRKFINNKFFVSNETSPELFDSFIQQNSQITDQLAPGKINIENTTPLLDTASAAIFCAFTSGETSERAVILFSTENIQENIASNPINLSFVVNAEGQVVVHPDYSVLKRGEDFSEHPVVSRLLSGKELNEQFTYKDVPADGKSKGEDMIGAYYRTEVGGCAAVTLVQTSVMLEGVRNTIRRNIYLTIAILAISVLVIWIFSSTLSSPLKDLTEVTNEINKGNFDTELINELKDKRKDEVGVLIRSVKAEQEMLNTVTRLTNPDVTKAIVRNDIDFQAHLKDVTIFFSDIRDFTSISDKINSYYGEKSAAVIIGFLNDYMSRMVNCIAITGGIVDKFEGDAIMAAWGVLRPDVSEYEKISDSSERQAKLAEHEKNVVLDALNAIKASVAMRYSLMEYNKEAKAYINEHGDDYTKPHVRIGSGINSGRVTVGFMGSEKYKLEHSSIGDAVNLASRTESSTKLCGTDMLITEDTYNLLKMDYIRCEENNYTIKEENLKNEITVEKIPVSFNVKGKGEQHFYGVVNMPSFDAEEFFKAENTKFANPDFKADPDCLKAVGVNGPKSLKEVRDLLEIPEPDFAKVNLDENEKKIQIK